MTRKKAKGPVGWGLLQPWVPLPVLVIPGQLNQLLEMQFVPLVTWKSRLMCPGNILVLTKELDRTISLGIWL